MRDILFALEEALSRGFLKVRLFSNAKKVVDTMIPSMGKHIGPSIPLVWTLNISVVVFPLLNSFLLLGLLMWLPIYWPSSVIGLVKVFVGMMLFVTGEPLSSSSLVVVLFYLDE